LGDIRNKNFWSLAQKNKYQQKYKDKLKYINAKIGLFLSNAPFFEDGEEFLDA
jgi:hypothetical protein